MFGGLEVWSLDTPEFEHRAQGCIPPNHRLVDADVLKEFTCKESTLLIYHEYRISFPSNCIS